MSDVPESDNCFYAYEIFPPVEALLRSAPVQREWMDNSNQRFAYRCLPLAIANQSGWFVDCPTSFSAQWNGGLDPKDVALVFDSTPPASNISSIFGSGVITFNMPFLFRTPKDINLWVKGPTNWPKDGVWPLEGIVETEWTAATFTMNWKLTRPGHIVRFERGEPICMVVPFPRNLLNSLEPVRKPLASNPELDARHRHWCAGRAEFRQKLEECDEHTVKIGWQKDYFRGHDPGTEVFNNHQTKLSLKPFH